MALARDSIFLFTDFTWRGPYVGQMESAIVERAPEARVIHLMHDAPCRRPDLAAYLLPAVCRALPTGSIVVAVVDPGVGSARRPLIVETGHGLFIGPDNGLLARLPGIRGASVIDWRPDGLAPSFHGRDLFGPVAAWLVTGEVIEYSSVPPEALVGADWPAYRPEVVYIDGFGNLIVGVDPDADPAVSGVHIGGSTLVRGRTFSDVAPGEPFWYRNALGLLEIAVNHGSAEGLFRLELGDKVLIDFR
jgi:S-adenosylmethionine hydrolase